MTRSKREKKKKVSGAIEWTERALTDLRAIDDYIAVDNPLAAERWIGRLIAKAEGPLRQDSCRTDRMTALGAQD